jgi:hypothetical protein
MGDVYLVTKQNKQLSKQVRKVFVIVDYNKMTQRRGSHYIGPTEGGGPELDADG